ncbi:hypothetical protein [uncultured Kordia sp.]|uniref:hypothetical protein n=1 Tax=uncultured Kordia sp. TaxID=507699 RepID=UPI0026354DD8|nr:hypothetical protein [uncultured Kordia sp.]
MCKKYAEKEKAGFLPLVFYFSLPSVQVSAIPHVGCDGPIQPVGSGHSLYDGSTPPYYGMF